MSLVGNGDALVGGVKILGGPSLSRSGERFAGDYFGERVHVCTVENSSESDVESGTSGPIRAF